MKTLLVIAEANDADAVWCRQALAESFRGPVVQVTPSEMVMAPQLSHRLGTDHESVQLTLARGLTLAGPDLAGVVNRIQRLPDRHFVQAQGTEHGYAAAELHAFFLGWLSALPCPMFNAPTPACLHGPAHADLAARHLAALAGWTVGDAPEAPVAGWGPVQVHWVLDQAVLGPDLSLHEQQVMQALSALWGGRLLQVQSRQGPQARVFVSASSWVDFRAAGPALAHAVARRSLS
jgi:hypothetical protein